MKYSLLEYDEELNQHLPTGDKSNSIKKLTDLAMGLGMGSFEVTDESDSVVAIGPGEL